VLLEGLGKLKKKVHLIRTRTRDLPACSVVPQPTMRPRGPPTNNDKKMRLLLMKSSVVSSAVKGQFCNVVI
jgi:hypothetical protein